MLGRELFRTSRVSMRHAFETSRPDLEALVGGNGEVLVPQYR
jgi:hypothetical protein